MKRLEVRKKIVLVLTIQFFALLSCSSDDTITETTDSEAEPDTETDSGAEAYILVPETGNNGGVYIINQNGEEVYSWDLDSNLGNDANLLDDGGLVVALKADNAQITLGGYGGDYTKDQCG